MGTALWAPHTVGGKVTKFDVLVENSRSSHDLVKENSLIYMNIMIPVLIGMFLYGNSSEKMNISYVTALWAPDTVGGRPTSGNDTGPGTCVRGGASPR